jgi:transcriptional regulator with XRE-family HTH domain/tetratricopeptide (TPR) repeat protein
VSGGRTRLRRARKERGWSQNDAAAKLYALGIELGVAEADLGVDARQISRWEGGKAQPGPLYTALMSRLYGLPTAELDLPPVVLPVAPVRSPNGPSAPADAAGEEFITLVVKRREFLEAVGGGVMAGLASTGPLSPAARYVLTGIVSRNIEDAWKLFHTADTEHMLAVSTAQIHMVQRHQADLHPGALPKFYSAAYRLLGATYHRRGRYQEALLAHEQAYLSALEGAETYNMAQSRCWQAYGMQMVGRHADSLALMNMALRLVSNLPELAGGRLHCRLLTCVAMNAALVGDRKLAIEMLHACELLLDQLPGPHEEFDRSAWLESAGVCALRLGDVDAAVGQLQRALNDTPVHWTQRRALTTIGLAKAFAFQGERDATLAAAYELLPQLEAVRSRELVDQFLHYVNEVLLTSFPNDINCLALIAEARTRLTDDD